MFTGTFYYQILIETKSIVKSKHIINVHTYVYYHYNIILWIQYQVVSIGQMFIGFSVSIFCLAEKVFFCKCYCCLLEIFLVVYVLLYAVTVCHSTEHSQLSFASGCITIMTFVVINDDEDDDDDDSK